MREIKPMRTTIDNVELLYYKIDGFTIFSHDLDEEKFGKLCHDMMHLIVDIYKDVKVQEKWHDSRVEQLREDLYDIEYKEVVSKISNNKG